MTLWRQVADFVQNECGAGRLTRTGRPQQREMLAEHGIDIKRAANILGREHRANFDMRAGIGGINLLHVGAGHRIDLCPRNRIAGDTATEIIYFAGQFFFVALAKKIDRRHDDAVFAFVHALVADAGQQPGTTDADLDLAADLPRHRDARVLMVGQFGKAGCFKGDLRPRACDFHDEADMMQPCAANCAAWCHVGRK